jgi:hypothetical protein
MSKLFVSTAGALTGIREATAIAPGALGADAEFIRFRIDPRGASIWALFASR